MGQEQARLFFNAYKNEEFDLVVHSELQRSKQTIAPFHNNGVQIIENKDINEISWGHQEGKPHTAKSLAEYRSVVESWQREEYEVGFKGGESAKDLSIRIGRFVSWLKIRSEKKVLICSHGRAIRALICLMKGDALNMMEQYKHHNTGVFKARLINNQFVFKTMNDTSHLNGLN